MQNIISFLLANADNCLVFIPRADKGVAMQTLWDIASLCASPIERERSPFSAEGKEYRKMLRALDDLVGSTPNVGSQVIHGANCSILLLLAQMVGNLIVMEGTNCHLQVNTPAGFNVDQAFSLKIEGGSVIFTEHNIIPPYQAPPETHELDDQARAALENDARGV